MVHQYKNNGYDIVLDVNSGAIHVVDDVTYDVIEMIDQSQPELYARDEIVSALSGKYGMVKSGVLMVLPKCTALLPRTMTSGRATTVKISAHSNPSRNFSRRFHRHHMKNTKRNAVTE